MVRYVLTMGLVGGSARTDWGEATQSPNLHTSLKPTRERPLAVAAHERSPSLRWPPPPKTRRRPPSQPLRRRLPAPTDPPPYAAAAAAAAAAADLRRQRSSPFTQRALPPPSAGRPRGRRARPEVGRSPPAALQTPPAREASPPAGERLHRGGTGHPGALAGCAACGPPPRLGAAPGPCPARRPEILPPRPRFGPTCPALSRRLPAGAHPRGARPRRRAAAARRARQEELGRRRLSPGSAKPRHWCGGRRPARSAARCQPRCLAAAP